VKRRKVSRVVWPTFHAGRKGNRKIPVCRVLRPKDEIERELVCRKSPAGKRQRRLFVLLLSGFLLLSFPKAWGADWKYIGETPKASYYYDAEDLVRQENVVRVWVRAVYSPEGRRMEAAKLGSDIRNLTDSRALEEINCRDKDYRAVAVVVYTMEKKVVNSDFKERGLDFILPDSIWEGLYKTLCR
jgi:Surface-adhesin protein E